MTADEAIAIARRIAEEEKWTWREPVHARRSRPWFVGRARWVVVTNWGMLGMSVRVVVDESGTVLEQGYLPR